MKNKYKTLIISCWVVLLCCFVVKLLCGNFFEIVCKNERFVNLCLFIDSNILKYVFNISTYLLSTFIYVLAIIKRKTTRKEKIIILVALIVFWFLKLLTYKVQLLAICIELLFIILLPFLIVRTKKALLFSVIGYILNLAFQVVSLLTKNISLGFIDNSTLIVSIFSIDYYIMIILFYLYRTKEEK